MVNGQKKAYYIWYTYIKSSIYAPGKEFKTTRFGYSSNEVCVDLLNQYGDTLRVVRIEEAYVIG